ncbi:uncharacterized protein MYCGRDRAFT_97860 [Zymoseptoria tritici IPO323]|uniref:Uncharacterized protein n=1 Tax=Zymoseptoria tritici (strain CBS 115943 / IPO323) TaxID=336722 RepID=F9XRL4_ZYMTI|nr:uncharacterized protein MYCGRDRAFT_97860 [Zymoseptoria tritici IPO323]EGP82108.1 hypothetical protein MYCGRDRAFT_97860 [Zymoseptoria tritici IPO323]
MPRRKTLTKKTTPGFTPKSHSFAALSGSSNKRGREDGRWSASWRGRDDEEDEAPGVQALTDLISIADYQNPLSGDEDSDTDVPIDGDEEDEEDEEQQGEGLGLGGSAGAGDGESAGVGGSADVGGQPESAAQSTTATPFSMAPPSLPTARIEGFGQDTSQVLAHKRYAGEPLTKFEFAIGLWCMLPMMDIREKLVGLNPLVQPSLSATEKRLGKDAERMYFLDMPGFCKAFFSTDNLADKMFTGLGELVDEPEQIWQGNVWHACIRVTSGEFAFYVAGPPKRPQTATTSAPLATPSAPASSSAPASAATPRSTRASAVERKKLSKAQEKAQKQAEAAAAATQQRAIDKAAAEAAGQKLVDSRCNEHRGYIGGSIFPSDVVRFRCNDYQCACRTADDLMHLDRVLAVAHDQRTVREHTGERGNVVVKIQRLVGGTNVPAGLQPAAEGNELFVLEDEQHIVLVADVAAADVAVYMHYTFDSAHDPQPLPPGSSDFFVRHIIGRNGDVRPVYKTNPIRGELEIMHFGRQQLEDKFVAWPANGGLNANGLRVRSMPLMIFIDGFGIFRDRYRSLTGWYLLFAAFTNKERNRRANTIPLTLAPHGSNAAGVIDAIGPSMSSLDAGMEVNGEMVCAMTLFFIGNMPQQQENSGQLKQNAKYGCRMCEHSRDEWKALNLDMVNRGRYHHEAMRIRRHMEAQTVKDRRKAIADDMGKSMRTDYMPLERIAPASDVVNKCPADPTHSELNGVTKLMHSVLLDAILTEQAKRHHPRPYFRGAVGLAVPELVTFLETATNVRPLPASFVVMVAFARIAESNTMLMSKHLSAEERRNLSSTVITGRQMYQRILEVAATASDNSPASRAVSRAGTPVRAGTPTGVAKSQGKGKKRAKTSGVPTPSTTTSASTEAMDIDEDAQQTASGEEPQKIRAVQFRHDMERPNMHTGLYYPDRIDEFALPSNTNVLIGEELSKEMILYTNKKNPERDLLQRMDFAITTRFTLQNAFKDEEPVATQLVQDVNAACPTLLDSLLPRSEKKEAVDPTEEDFGHEKLGVMSTTNQIRVSASSKHAAKKVPADMAPLATGGLYKCYIDHENML